MATRKPTDPEPNQDLPDEKQPPRGPGNNRGKSEDAPGHNKDDDDEAVDESPADEEGDHVEHHREDPNTYPDPDNPPRTP
jgi:hypothetical protein